ncbi:MAG TPA: hypothetical protein VGR45_18000 [Stellaceae bacterium]|nr:hypothetical protein [Stellaceae bacterium]
MELDELHEGISQSLSTAQAPEITAQQRAAAAQQRRASALQIASLAAAGHHAAGDLQEHFPQTTRYIRDAAAGFEHISSFLRDPSIDEAANFIGNLGRRQPAAVIAGVFLLAVGISWFLTSSGNASENFGAEGREGGAYGLH